MSEHNLSYVSDGDTARTNREAAFKRAENLALCGASHVLELCVGPSLEVFDAAYGAYGIQVTGNDIDARWKRLYPQGKWLVGDAMEQDYNEFDSVVFAPPLSRGCTGKREDSLQIEKVRPNYYKFLAKVISQNYNGNVVLVLPGRVFATRQDRIQFYRLVHVIAKSGFKFEVIELKCGQRRIRKYVDLYLCRCENV